MLADKQWGFFLLIVWAIFSCHRLSADVANNQITSPWTYSWSWLFVRYYWADLECTNDSTSSGHGIFALCELGPGPDPQLSHSVLWLGNSYTWRNDVPSIGGFYLLYNCVCVCVCVCVSVHVSVRNIILMICFFHYLLSFMILNWEP